MKTIPNVAVSIALCQPLGQSPRVFPKTSASFHSKWNGQYPNAKRKIHEIGPSLRHSTLEVAVLGSCAAGVMREVSSGELLITSKTGDSKSPGIWWS